MGGMIEPLLLQPTQVTSAPRYLAREDATVLEHEAAHLLAMHTVSTAVGFQAIGAE